ncbi:hypothetical protein ACWJJH_02880 [Endozoicomonadaceae bacterium StTr2]
MKINIRELNIKAPVNNTPASDSVMSHAFEQQQGEQPGQEAQHDDLMMPVIDTHYNLALPDNLLIEQVLDWKRW